MINSSRAPLSEYHYHWVWKALTKGYTHKKIAYKAHTKIKSAFIISICLYSEVINQLKEKFTNFDTTFDELCTISK